MQASFGCCRHTGAFFCWSYMMSDPHHAPRAHIYIPVCIYIYARTQQAHTHAHAPRTYYVHRTCVRAHRDSRRLSPTPALQYDAVLYFILELYRATCVQVCTRGGVKPPHPSNKIYNSHSFWCVRTCTQVKVCALWCDQGKEAGVTQLKHFSQKTDLFVAVYIVLVDCRLLPIYIQVCLR